MNRFEVDFLDSASNFFVICKPNFIPRFYRKISMRFSCGHQLGIHAGLLCSPAWILHKKRRTKRCVDIVTLKTMGMVGGDQVLPTV